MNSLLNKDYPDRESVIKAVETGQTNFTYQDLTGLDLSGIEFAFQTDFSYADLSNTDMRKVILPQAIIRFANLANINAHYADFTGSNFYDSTAERADFSKTNLSGCDLTAMRVRRALFEAQVMAWIPAAIEYGIRLPVYSPDYVSPED